MVKPRKLDINPCLEEVGYGTVQADYREVHGRMYYRADEMDAYLKDLTDRILDLEAKLRHFQRNTYEREALDMS